MYNLPIFKQLVELLQWVLITLHDWFASWGLTDDWTWGMAIIGLTIIVRLILFPLTWKQFSSAQAMQAIQPKVKELQKKYKSDRQKLQQETMKLYQEHRVNPFASCLPIVLQLPVFIALYVAISGRADYLNEVATRALAEASFLWIPHLGEKDTTYILLVVYVVTQLISTELMLTAQTDKQQKYLMRAMPIIFVIFLWNFPAGLFVYWVTTNLWTIGQQLLIRRFMKPKDLATMAAKPRKRSRFVEAIMSAQGQGTEQDDILAKRRQKAAELSAGKKTSSKSGATKAGSGKRGDTRQGGAQQGGTQQGKKGPAQAKKGGRKPPPGKGTHRQNPPSGGQSTSKSGPAGG